MKRKIFSVFIFLTFLFSLSIAQTQSQIPQRRNIMSQEVQYLIRLLRDLRELDKDKKIAITKSQAQKLIPILQNLGKVQQLPKKEAEKFINQIEGVLSDAQLTYLDKLQIERQKRMEELRQRMSQQMQTNQQNQFTQQWRNQQTPQNISEKERQEFQKFMEAWSKGQPLNPFYYLSIYKKQLNDLIDYLKKK